MLILKNLSKLLKGKLRSNDNLHRIAISNLQNEEYRLKRWWRKKYRIPPKDLDDYTTEELYLEFIEDYYDKNPEKIADFEKPVDDWKVPDHIEELMRKRRAKSKGRKLRKYITLTDKNLTEEQCQEIFDGLGRKQKINDDEFEEVFGED